MLKLFIGHLYTPEEHYFMVCIRKKDAREWLDQMKVTYGATEVYRQDDEWNYMKQGKPVVRLEKAGDMYYVGC